MGRAEASTVRELATRLGIHRRKDAVVVRAAGRSVQDQVDMRVGRRRLIRTGVRPDGSARNRKRNMSTGTVKFFSDERGFGFISREVGDDVFVHHSNIEGDGRRSLAEGDRVEFETGSGRKGEEARNVRVV
jgi:cold shock protein